MGLGGGKGGGSSYTPPTVPALPTYVPPKPLPALPKDPAADYTAKKQEENLAALGKTAEAASKKAKEASTGPLLYTREEQNALKTAKGPLE